MRPSSRASHGCRRVCPSSDTASSSLRGPHCSHRTTSPAASISSVTRVAPATEVVRQCSSPVAPRRRRYVAVNASPWRFAVSSRRRHPRFDSVWAMKRGGGDARGREVDLADHTYSDGTPATSRTTRRVRGPMCSAKQLPTHVRFVAETRTTPPAKALSGGASTSHRCSSEVGRCRWLLPPCRRSCENMSVPPFSWRPSMGKTRA
mmetsp:Transcript_3569/g.13888  ORF Transcript_3569/g.13888 Transcript_3569/m.13888 type:complete len:205 (-) Transcript_3569:602-1216(-)